MMLTLFVHYACCIVFFACGIAVGATIVADWLDKRRVAKPAEPVVPPVEMPRAWVLHLAELNRPTVLRRKGRD